MKVKFLPQNIEIEITPEQTLLQAAHEKGIGIKSVCKGNLVCTECRVKIVEGESNILPPSKAELNVIGTSWQLESRRFACQVRCFGDITVDLTEQVAKADTARKNIRGFKSNRPISESIAVLDTMILNEKIEAPSDQGRGGEGADPAKPEQNRDGGGRGGRGQGGRGGGEGGGHREGGGRGGRGQGRGGGNRGGQGGGGRGPRDGGAQAGARGPNDGNSGRPPGEGNPGRGPKEGGGRPPGEPGSSGNSGGGGGRGRRGGRGGNRGGGGGGGNGGGPKS